MINGTQGYFYRCIFINAKKVYQSTLFFISVLDRSHTEHREDSFTTRTIIFIAAAALSSILLVIIVIILCHRLRRIIHARQAPALAAVEASGLPYLHPTTNALFQTLQRLHTIEQHHRDPPSHLLSPQLAPPSGMNFNSIP